MPSFSKPSIRPDQITRTKPKQCHSASLGDKYEWQRYGLFRGFRAFHDLFLSTRETQVTERSSVTASILLAKFYETYLASKSWIFIK